MTVSKNKTVILNIVSTIVLQGLAFISGPVFSSALGTANYGVAAVYMTWVQVASAVFSLQTAGGVGVSRVYFPMEEQDKYQSGVLSLASITYVLFSALTMIVVLILQRWIPISAPMVIVGLLQGWGLCVVNFYNEKFTYEFKADKNLILSVTVAVLTLALSVALVYLFPSSNNYWGKMIGDSSVYFIIGLVLFIYIVSRGKTIYNKEYWKFALRIGIPTIFHVLAHLILNQSDRVMLRSMISDSAAGIYALACTFGAVLSAIWVALNNSWVPFYYEFTKTDNTQEIKKHASNYMELFTVITVGFIFLSREVFHIYANKDFWGGADLIPIFSISYYMVFLYSFPVNFEFYHKKNKMIAVGTVSAAIFNIILNYLFINWFGLFGAVVATAMANGLLFVFHFIIANKAKEGKFPFRLSFFLPGPTAVFLCVLINWLTRDYWMIRWGIGAILGVYILVKLIRRREII